MDECVDPSSTGRGRLSSAAEGGELLATTINEITMFIIEYID